MKLNHEDVKEFYLKTNSTVITAKFFNCSVSSIHFILKKFNIKTPKKGEAFKIYSHTENFFETIDCEEKAYWLGFLMADGYVSKNKNDITLALGIKDKSHLLKYKNSINSTSPVKDCVISKGPFKGKEFSRINITSNKTKSDLESLGCVNAKSLILQFPNIDKSLHNHFIRGYFDGDGSVFLSNDKHHRSGKISSIIYVSIVGTLEFLNSMFSIINIGTKECIKRNHKLVLNNTFQYRVKRHERCKQFYEYLYKDATLYLERKKQIFDNYFKE